MAKPKYAPTSTPSSANRIRGRRLKPGTRAPVRPPEPSASLLHTSVYAELQRRFVTGQISPGSFLSTRGIAAELAVSQMPVREALRRLAAEGAIEIRSKRRIAVPAMTASRFDDLLRCRLLLEPEAAAAAFPQITPALLRKLRATDKAMGVSMRNGDVAGYMQGNFDFHFLIYRAQPRRTLLQLIETLWLQFGPHMRVVYGRFDPANLVDQHRVAIARIEAGDQEGLRKAIADDIRDGMGLIGPPPRSASPAVLANEPPRF